MEALFRIFMLGDARSELSNYQKFSMEALFRIFMLGDARSEWVALTNEKKKKNKKKPLQAHQNELCTLHTS